MDKKIKVTFLYRDCEALTQKSFYTYFYNFYFNALKRNSEIDVNYILTNEKYDVTKLKGKTDVILLYDTFNTGQLCVLNELEGINKTNIPIISKVGDPWAAKNFDVKKYHEKLKVDAYFGPWDNEFFKKYFPSNFKFKTIFFGIEPSFYEKITPFNDRIKKRILNSGAVARTNFTNRIYQKLMRGDSDPMKHYKLRTMCNKLPYVDYTSTLEHEFIGDKYPLKLNKYAASIAATTDTYTIKYFEIPAASCLTFMEVTENNFGKSLGFKDGESAIFINKNNYQEKFEEYLNDTENPKWEEIAQAGREHALTNFTNDKGVESLVELIKEFV
ncbi:MAG: hypothetical protein COA77_03425 [Thaumarchaeota archaeon]|nr:MAG: hypothetical protein COA77_03425 [Nitrososphaerota archaeon]